MDFKDVFDAHPDVKEIYVVGRMPFIVKAHAEAFAHSSKSKVETVSRAAKAAKAEEAPVAEAPKK